MQLSSQKYVLCYRFWYENPGVFTQAQLSELRQASLARVICDNSDDINQIQPDVFKRAKYPDGMVTCDSEKIPYIDLKLWAHCCYGNVDISFFLSAYFML